MSITDKTRKLLWGGSGKRCAFCKGELIMEATSRDDESVVGEECHIVSGAPNGPRHDPDFPQDEIDSYSNLVLLCRGHHKMVDDQPKYYTADILRKLKASHESWVRESLDNDGIVWVPQIADSLEATFQKVKESMPDLIAEMESDLCDGNVFTREFYLIHEGWMYNLAPGTQAFTYSYEKHDSLEGKIQVLENKGFVLDVTTGKMKKYRMAEEFVELLVAD